MTTGPTEPSTYPDSWDDLPGTRTHNPSPEHKNAKEQEYYLQDESAPVKKGAHTRDPLRTEPAEDTDKYFGTG